MTEEVDESQPQEKWNRTPEEQDRIQAMSDRQLDASNTLAELSELKGDFSYWSANASTHASLFDLVLIGAELSAHSPSDLLREQSAKLRTLLPFTEEELGGMAVRMKARENHSIPESSEDWYRDATSEDVLLLDRWRRWLDYQFHEDHVDDPPNAGKQLIVALEEIGHVFNEIV